MEAGSVNAARGREKAEVRAEFRMGKAEKQRQTVEGFGYKARIVIIHRRRQSGDDQLIIS